MKYGTSIKDIIKDKDKETDEIVLDDIKLDETDIIKNKKQTNNFDISVLLKEYTIFIIVYVIMSQHYIHKLFSEHIPLLKNKNTISYVIYAFVIMTIFAILRYFIIKNE